MLKLPLRSSLSPLSAGACRRRYLGSYSRMLDLGGAPSSQTDRTGIVLKNTAKHLKVQAVFFDFLTLTRSFDKDNNISTAPANLVRKNEQKSSSPIPLGKVQPNIDLVQQVAAVLNIKLGDSGENKSVKNEREDDLSLLLTDSDDDNKKTKPQVSALADWSTDIRTKYAAKLASRGSGIAGIEHAKHQVEDNLRSGDSAGHLAARQHVASTLSGGAGSSSAASNTKWMAGTGTGSLLQYLTQRSMKICLLPSSSLENNKENEGKHMEDIKKQLHEVVFTLLVKDVGLGVTVAQTIQTTLRKLDLQDKPAVALLVSDRDDYIRAAKEANMVTCRIVPPNARRGNVSAHYTVPSIADVKEVINEINGISYRTILQS